MVGFFYLYHRRIKMDESTYKKQIEELANNTTKLFTEISKENNADFLQRHNAMMYLVKKLLKMEN
jgi:hypothetical protein